MLPRRPSVKHWLAGLTAGAAVYAGLWFITESHGVRQVRNVAIQAMRQPNHQADASEPGDDWMAGPVYQCSAGAYAPFLVRADYRWQNGTQSGEGRTLYLWLLGRTVRVGEI